MQKVCIHAYIVLPIVLNLEFLSASGGKFALIGGKRRWLGQPLPTSVGRTLYMYKNVNWDDKHCKKTFLTTSSHRLYEGSILLAPPSLIIYNCAFVDV